jgi:hypothetical protein
MTDLGGHSVAGYCPACGRESLILASDRRIVCCRLECPRPTAADEVLADRETEHVVQFNTGDFTVLHPLRERLDNALMDCQLHHDIASLDGPPVAPGRYRACRDGGRWTWEAV